MLDEQQAYYRARAGEYDEWWQRRGRYDRGEDMTEAWRRQVATLEAALASFNPSGDVLELAAGTGWWTERLARIADRLTVIDASAETLAINRERVGRDDVEYVVADLFEWRPQRRYDVVFFSFWLSHVPRPRFSTFWELVRSCLAPGGRAFLVDNREDRTDRVTEDPTVIDYRTDEHVRRLNDGSEYRVVKVMYEPDELRTLLAAEQWKADIDGTRWFIFGSAEPAQG